MPVGDFEPDGSADGAAFLFATAGNNSTGKQVLFHGIDGSPLSDSSADPLGASVDGRGDDLVNVSTKHAVTILVRRGRDDSQIFTRTLPSSSGISDAVAYGAALTSRRCSDVLVLGQGKGVEIGAVLASNGQVRWSLHHAPGDLRPGAITRPSQAPSVRCT